MKENDNTMDNTIYIDGGNKRHLSDVMPELPENVILNKTVVGCGATYTALHSKFKTVLVVPYRSIIINKEKACKDENIDCIGIYSDAYDRKAHSIEALREFKGEKIIVTYDSLYKLEEVINPGEWNIVIDECHKLIDSAALRSKAVKSVIDNYKKYKSFCFLTATPVPDEYQLPALRDIQKMQILWNNLEEVTVNYIALDKGLYENAALIALEHLKKDKPGNAHIFINSVKGICKIVGYLQNNAANLSKNLRIVCADNDYNDAYIQEELGSAYHNEPNTTKAKAINFYTSTCFEGSDLFDPEGVSYVITDGSLDHTKVNILTTLPQIANRIRNSRYKNTLTLIYTPNAYYSCTTEAEYAEHVKAELARYSKSVTDFGNVETTTQTLIIRGSLDCQYLIDEDEKLYLNEAVMYNEMFSYRTIHQTYSVIEDEESRFTSNTIDYHYIPQEGPAITGLNKVKLGKKANFSDLCIEYIAIRASSFYMEGDKIETLYPVIKEAYEVLGVDKMKALKFQQSDITRELIKVDTLKSNTQKVRDLLKYRVGQWFTSQDIKADLTKVYEILEVKNTPTATDINIFYAIAPHSKKINGKLVRGFKILSSTFN